MIVCNSCDHAHFRYGNAEGADSSETLVISYMPTRPRIVEGSDFASEFLNIFSVIRLHFCPLNIKD
jgi:hypothetical protein